MAVVTRRVLQRILQENAGFLTTEQYDKHVFLLNEGGARALAAEYEVLILNALSHLANTPEHEPKLAGCRRPDVLMELGAQVFIADITTISDADAHNGNPIEQLSKEFYSLLNEEGISGAGFHIDVDGGLVGSARKQKMKLDLPKRGSELRLAVRSELGPFVRGIKAAPTKSAEISLSNFAVRISYDPKNRGMSSHHATYTAPYSLDNNPLANALRKKLRQLKGTGFGGVLGTFVCDGDSDSLRDLSGLSYSLTHFSAEQIISRCFDNNTSLSFVYGLTVTEPFPLPLSSPRAPQFHGRLFLNPRASHPCSEEQISLLRAVVSALPPSRCTPVNALHILCSPTPLGTSFYGGGRMSDTEIRLSARALVHLLAGRLTLEQFLRDQHLTEIPFFENRLKRGQMLIAAHIERVPDDDDDWIVLTFGEPDPAIAPFR